MSQPLLASDGVTTDSTLSTRDQSAKDSNAKTGRQHTPLQPSALRQALPLHASNHAKVDTSAATSPVRAYSSDVDSPSATNSKTPVMARSEAGPQGVTTGRNLPGLSFARPKFLRGYGSVDTFDSRRSWDASRTLHADGNNSVSDMEQDQHVMRRGSWISKRGNRRETAFIYLLYYLPITNWIRSYKWTHVKGDLVAALTMASFYIPMSLSYASNLGHIPPINGLYSFIFQPFVYAMLGTCTQMVVGPEAAGSLLTGQVVRENIKRGNFAEGDAVATSRVAGAVTGLAGAVILLAGLCRLGFLDSVLSRPFLRGFISSIGIVILVDQLIPEMGLDGVAAHTSGAAHGSSLQKLVFIFQNSDKAHKLTCAVSFGAFLITMLCREAKKRMQHQRPTLAYIPDRFLVVAISALMSWYFSWDKRGLNILGDISSGDRPFKVHFPLSPTYLDQIGDAFSTAFLVALLGFFESSVAAKSLGNSPAKPAEQIEDEDDYDTEAESDEVQNLILSPNRELVALGCANLLGGLFMSLPAFGGYGRSKVNASTGGRTPMSSIFLSLITVICTLFLLPYFYHIPKGVLSAMISVVAYSLMEEAPHDVYFFYKISGWNELTLMLLIFSVTLFWNLRVGMAVGIGLSLLRLLRHATRPRIQLMGRVPGTDNDFVNAEDSLGALEFFPRCLIVKIPEPLTFANTGSLKDRLRRLEDHGTNAAHPAQPRARSMLHNKNIIFDVHGVTSLDPAAAQVLLELVTAYRDRGVRVFFCRIPSRRSETWRLMQVSGLVKVCGGEAHFVKTVQAALDLTEKESGRHLQPVEESPADDTAGATHEENDTLRQTV